MHMCIRSNCSALNSDLFVKNIMDSASCTCGAIENAYHFFFNCGRYLTQRNDLLYELDFLPYVSLNILLYGHVSKIIFESFKLLKNSSKNLNDLGGELNIYLLFSCSYKTFWKKCLPIKWSLR